jgi:hypothetical protein
MGSRAQIPPALSKYVLNTNGGWCRCTASYVMSEKRLTTPIRTTNRSAAVAAGDAAARTPYAHRGADAPAPPPTSVRLALEPQFSSSNRSQPAVVGRSQRLMASCRLER